jgi:predicted polyphosphate/ATP-dependent NAD kinase
MQKTYYVLMVGGKGATRVYFETAKEAADRARRVLEELAYPVVLETEIMEESEYEALEEHETL